MASLVFLGGEPRRVHLGAHNTLGRHPVNTIQLLDKIASKNHAEIVLRAGRYVLLDLGSINGTFVNLERVRGEHLLNDGDEIAIGATRLRFSAGDAVAAPPPGPPPPPGWQAPAGAARRAETVTARTLDAVRVGRAFAFVPASVFEEPGMGWVTSLLGAARPRVISRLARGEVAVPGGFVKGLDLAPLRLSVVTSDKAVYREGRDTARLLVVSPFAARSFGDVVVLQGGREYTKRRVRLDANGIATLALSSLPAGRYEVRTTEAADADPACEFSVVEYRLAPLVASLTERRLEGQRLVARLHLTTYGVAVQGDVDLELSDHGRRVSRQRLRADEGALTATFDLQGEGPFSIEAQLVAHPSRTASVPIVGSRSAERSETPFSLLGLEIQGSLLPQEGSREVRGIHLTEGAIRTSPFRVERIDGSTIKLRATTAIAAATIAVVDASVPRAGADAVDVQKAPWPGSEDERYRDGDARFRAGLFLEAAAVFDRARAELPRPHPAYAYYAACCHARAGDRAEALAWLRTAFRDGWTDLAHMAKDDDLAILREDPAFEAMRRGGVRLVDHEGLEAGAEIVLAVPSPTAAILIGAFVGDTPWEGWLVSIAPDAPAPELVVPPHARPGESLEVGMTGPSGGSVYVVVKDARLVVADTPSSRLAGQIKTFAKEVGERLAVGEVKQTFAQMTPPPVPFPPQATGYPLAYPAPPPMPSAAGLPPPAPATGRPMPAPQSRFDDDDRERGFGPDLDDKPERDAGPALPGPTAAKATAPKAGAVEPDVLFAGVVSLVDGKATLSVSLPDAVADYLVDAFVLRGLDWARIERRVRAEKLPYVSLELPAFVHPEDVAVGRVHVQTASGRARVSVLRDGVPLPLFSGGRPIEAEREIGAGEVTFQATPGAYAAQVIDPVGSEVDRQSRTVDAPGRLRRVVRTVQFLSPGERLGLSEGVLALRVLPALDRPLRALVTATSDYGHACCEQTAAKILAAGAMFTFARDDDERARAEAIVIAGVRREASMWLRGRGFKMYPESADQPSPYWSPLAARHLWSVGLLAPSPGLKDSIELALEMARDASAAHDIAWPPRHPVSCQDAYAILRYGDASQARHAVSTVEHAIQKGSGSDRGSSSRLADPSMPGAVGARVESAYAAASLLRARVQMDRAIGLVNSVTHDIGEEGRLYSTVDSVAAIALMNELSAAGIGSAGRVRVDGREMTTQDAQRALGPEELAAVDAVVAVEVTRVVEERWDALATNVPLRVALEKNGRPNRRLTVGDAVELRVQLEGGYKAGDLLWVCLPDSLSRLEGGAQLKRFSVDFCEKNELVVPLAATSTTLDGRGGIGTQRFAVCVRNMFEEERAGNPGLLEVSVSPPN
jgi:hypothetical protein